MDPSSEALQKSQIAWDQRFFLDARPALQLSFSFECRAATGELLQVSELNGSSSTREGTGKAFLVIGHPLIKIDGFADVETSVRTSQDVNVVHVTTMPRRVISGRALAPDWPFDSLRSLRAFSLSVACHERSSRFAEGKRELSRMVEAAGVEPASENTSP
jgi:hypothetical protein